MKKVKECFKNLTDKELELVEYYQKIGDLGGIRMAIQISSSRKQKPIVDNPTDVGDTGLNNQRE